MTRLFLEIKNITLCAEPSFFICYIFCGRIHFFCALNIVTLFARGHFSRLRRHFLVLAPRSEQAATQPVHKNNIDHMPVVLHKLEQLTVIVYGVAALLYHVRVHHIQRVNHRRVVEGLSVGRRPVNQRCVIAYFF